MGTYHIRDLEQLSGIKAHTLRVWEQRYGILIPKRTETNIRYYDDEDLRFLLNIAFLNRNSYRISVIADMTREEIAEKVIHIANSNLEPPNQINALVLAMVTLDEDRFEKIIATNTLQFGFERTMLDIVYPFLIQIGILWQTDNINPAHEHFISNLIRQKLIVAIDGQITNTDPAAKKYALFLPESETHELSLLFAAYIVKARNNKAIYLGQNLPVADLKTVHEVYEPDFYFTISTSAPNRDEFVPFLEKIVEDFADTQFLITGYQAMQAKDSIPDGVILIESIEDFIAFVEKNSQPD